jgi:hypothetical protein
MTVRELRVLLDEMPPDAEVVVNMRSNELGNGMAVGYVEEVDAERWKSSELEGEYRWRERLYTELIDEEYYEYATIVNINSGRKS